MHELIKKKKSHTVSFGVRSNDWHGELDPGLVKFKLKHVSPGTMLIPANVLGKAAQQVQREKGTTQREKVGTISRFSKLPPPPPPPPPVQAIFSRGKEEEIAFTVITPPLIPFWLEM
ncbi:unnamed protein product [Onchocerca flexuosa]|uniref:Uncharacterized protein n=1 Tax=Onchocerca flexuosa TaxID=387005 RepID=A0A183I150_9BILA|nr:unnamed protein product [Onchocerca flexuosa]